MLRKRVLVLGSTGLLGHQLCLSLPQKNCQVFGSFRRYPEAFSSIYQHIEPITGVDVLDEASLMHAFDIAKPDVVINAIGIVKQLEEASERYISVAINAFLPHRLARLAQKYQAKLIHISTDCVFNGEKGQYTEADLSDAEDLYGKSKYLGETDDSVPHALTLRTSIIGHELVTPTHGLIEWFLSQQGRTVKGFQKAIYTGLTTQALSTVFAHIIHHFPDLYGMYHLASEPISKYDLLHLVKEIYHLDIDIQADTLFSCDRSMLMTRLHSATGYVVPSWPEMIQEMYLDYQQKELQCIQEKGKLDAV